MPLISNALRTPSMLVEMPVSRLPIEMPPRMASIYKLTARPRRCDDTVACKKVFAEVLLTLIARPARISNAGNPQNHGLTAASAMIAP